MGVYLLMFFLSCLFLELYQKKSDNKRKIYLAIAILFPCIVAGVRSINVGTDLKVYVYYQYALSQKFTSFIEYFNASNIDFLYALFTYIVTKIFKNFNVLLFLFQLLNNFCFIYFLINYYDNNDNDNKFSYSLAYFIYLTTFFFRSLNLVRQCLGVSCVLIAFLMYKKNKRLAALLMTLIAYLFHSSAFIAILLFFIYELCKINDKRSKIILTSFLVFLIFVVALSSFIIPHISNFFLFSRLSTITNSEYLKDTPSIDKIDTLFKLFWIFLIYLISKNKSSEISNFGCLFYIAILDFILYEFSIFIDYGERISLYFGTISNSILIPQLPKLIPGDRFNKKYIIACIYIAFFAYFIGKYYYQNAGRVFPYELFLR